MYHTRKLTRTQIGLICGIFGLGVGYSIGLSEGKPQVLVKNVDPELEVVKMTFGLVSEIIKFTFQIIIMSFEMAYYVTLGPVIFSNFPVFIFRF